MSLVNNFSILLLIAHYLGDYPFQPEKLADKKKEKLSANLIHFAIHFALLAALGVWGFCQGLGPALLAPLLTVFGTHVALDLIKRTISQMKCPRNKPGTESVLYILDQLLHVLVIFLAGQVFFAPVAERFALGTFITRDMLKWALLFILIGKPANVSFKVLFARYQYKEEPESDAESTNNAEDTRLTRMAVGIDPSLVPAEKPTAPKETHENLQTVAGAGAIIGNMERILSAIFMATGQWAAIGVIFTAKSIARFKQIEKNKQFAEYYLIGTLYSILFVVLMFFLIIGFEPR